MINTTRNLTIGQLRLAPPHKLAFVGLPANLKVENCNQISVPHTPHLHLGEGTIVVADKEYDIQTVRICPGKDARREWRTHQNDINLRARALGAAFSVSEGKPIFGLQVNSSYSHLPMSIRKLSPEAAEQLAATGEEGFINFEDPAVFDEGGPVDTGFVTLEAPDASVADGTQAVVVAGKISFSAATFENGEKALKFAAAYRIHWALLRHFLKYQTLTSYVVLDWMKSKYETDHLSFTDIMELEPHAPGGDGAGGVSRASRQQALANRAAERNARKQRGSAQLSQDLAKKEDLQVAKPEASSPTDMSPAPTEAADQDDAAVSLAKSRSARKNKGK